jgi:cyclic pyranopterin phosphate synthase
MPEEGVPGIDGRKILTFEEIVRFVRCVRGVAEVSKVRITGGEPLLRSGLPDLIAMLSREGIEDFALTTNGRRLAEAAVDLRRAGLRRVNVSLDSLDPATYGRLSRMAGPQPTLEGIEAAVEAGLSPVKLNTVLMRGCNDNEVVPLVRWALDRGCVLRFLELMPIGWAREHHSELFVSCGEALEKLREAFTLEPAGGDPGSTSRSYRVRDREGREGVVGIIPSVTQPFCNSCRRLRLTSTGEMIACLAQGKGPDVRELLRHPSRENSKRLRDLVSGELGRKAGRDCFAATRPMACVGG